MYKLIAFASMLACTSAVLTAPGGPEEPITTLPGGYVTTNPGGPIVTVTSLPGHSETVTSLPGHSETVPDSPTDSPTDAPTTVIPPISTPSTTLPTGSNTPPWWTQSPTPGWSTSHPIGSSSPTPSRSGGNGPTFTGAAEALYKPGTIYAVAGVGALVGAVIV